MRRKLASSLRSPAFWVIAIALVVATVANIATNQGMMTESSSWAEERGPAISSNAMLREGSTLPELMGTFRIQGDRLQFVEKETNRAFRCLENLMLQRVHQVIGDEPNETSWIVNGKVTEYRGENFLFVEMIRRTR